MVECKICNKEFKNTRELSEHLKINHPEISKLEYLMNYHFGSKIGLCRNCGKQVNYISFSKYNIYCCKKCRQDFEHKHPEMMEALELKRKQTCIKKYGAESSAANKEVIEKCKKTKLERYGDSNYNNIEKCKKTKLERYGDSNYNNFDLAKKTNLEKYGAEYTFKSDLVKQKIKETNLERYGDSKYNNIEKCKKTNLEKYGVECVLQLKSVRELAKQTNLEKYGCEYALQSDIIKEKRIKSNIEKYGVEYPIQTPEVANLTKLTNLEKYGTEYTFQSDIIKEKTKQTYLKKYGVDHPSKSEIVKLKIYKTHKRNNSFNTSKPEIKLLEILQNNFSKFDIEYQYKSPKYPYNCDFYIKSLDLYIELQGSWTHGKAPFDPKNPDHIKKLNDWILKSQTSRFYRNAIDVWTRADVEKRKIALENNLNYIEVFDSETFKELDFLFKNSNIN